VQHDEAGHQKSDDQFELPLDARGEAPCGRRSGEAESAVQGDERSGLDGPRVMERIVEARNLRRALKRVQQNRGSPGVDGLTVKALPGYLRDHWPRIREELLAGRYQPSVVRRVGLPKPDGGMRLLGIPTVLDRFIQQAVLQVLQASDRSHVLRKQLRISAGPKCTRRGGSGTTVRAGRPQLGRRH
jgi:RNA-directed DNA polymerase